MSNRGLWMMLGAAGLSGLLAVACGSSDSGASTDSTGTGGTTGKAGSGGAKAGTGGTVAGGSGGAAAGTGGATAGGKAGSAGKAGGTSSPTIPEPASIGKACSSDSACGTGGKCIKSDSTDFLGVGAPNGYCSMDCTDFLKEAITNPNTTQPDPCGDGASCLNFGDGDGADKAKGVCVQLCSFGSPELEFKLSDTKCRGRDDVACFPLHASETDPKVTPKIIRAEVNGEQIPLGFCRPLCTDDTSCKSGYKCDLGSGGCIPKGTKCQSHETRCDPTMVDANGDPVKQCEGICVSLYGSDATPADKQKIGICMDPCSAGNTASCDGLNGSEAFCGLYNIWGYDGEGSVDLGSGDQAVCGWFATSATSDNDCAWEAGSFVRTFTTSSGPLAICAISRECTADADCTYECTTAADCDAAAGDTCTGGKCMKKDGTPNNGGSTCQEVTELKTKFCLDHKPTGLKPKGQPGCTGAGGAGGAGGGGGAGGAAAGAGGAAAGAGGAAAGAGGAAAGAGGAAAGAGGDAGAGGSTGGTAGNAGAGG